MKWIFILLLLPLESLSQKKDTVVKFLDGNLQLTTEKNAAYFGVSIKEKDGWLLYALYPDTTPVIKAWFKDKNLKIKHGPYFIYYPKRVLAQAGYFFNNKMNGVWQSWHANGYKKDSGLVQNNQMIRQWKEWYPNGQIKYDCTFGEITNNFLSELADAHPVLREGSFTSWYENGMLESTGFYKHDVMEGEWKFYHSNGRQSTTEFYKNGKVISLQCFDSTGKEAGDLCSISKPALLKNFGDYKQYIFQNLVWPEEAIKKKMEGSVKVRFTVSKKGTLENLVVQGDHDVLKKAVIELFKSMDDWYPAVSHNRIIDWDEEFTIPFYKR